MTIASNFASIDQYTTDSDIRVVYLGRENDFSVRALWRLVRIVFRGTDVIVFNQDHTRMYLVCLLLATCIPRRQLRIVSVDLLLRPARTIRDRLLNGWKRWLLRQVDTFILYFRDVDGYVREFGIPRDRIKYIPFKVNDWGYIRLSRDVSTPGEYILLSGATLRDYSTYIDAVRLTGLPSVLLLPGAMRATYRKESWYQRGIPNNLRIEFHTDGKQSTFLRYIQDARIVCFPRFAWDIASTGISGYLCAMGFGRFVAISRGPGAEDVLEQHDAAAFFASGDSVQLANIMKRAWNDDSYRHRIAMNGTQYAQTLGGEERLLTDIVHAVI